MAGFDFDDNSMKSEKTIKFYGFGEIKKVFRITEIFILLALLTWAVTRLPFAVRISGEYLRQLVSIVVSHLFVFLSTNLIILVLFLKSRGLFMQHDFQDYGEIHVDFCQEFIGDDAHFTGESFRQTEKVVYQDKQTIVEVTKVRAHRRSQSENFLKESECVKQLRRSQTERHRRVEEEEEAEVVDEMSNEEFQRAIETFIAKQIKFHQEEKLAIVLHGV